MAKKECPRVGDRIVLKINGDLSKNTPLGMVEDFGYGSGWKHNGVVLTGEQTQEFMVVEVGYQPNLAAVQRAIEAKYGVKPEDHRGQWMQAYRAEYEANGTNPVGIADASWVYPNGFANFPYVYSDGRPYFYWTGGDLYEYWLWLVPAPAPGK